MPKERVYGKGRARVSVAGSEVASGQNGCAWWQLGLGLLLLCIIAYVPTWTNGGFIWDDDDYVTENLALRSLRGLWQIWSRPGTTPQYYPMVHTTFWTEYHLWGLWAPGFHFVNVLLHAANATLLYKVLRRLAVPGALLAAAIFAAHPVHAESVAWITERKNVLSGLFYLLSMLAFFRAVPESINGAAIEQKTFRRFYLISLVCFAAALLSKTVTCTLPAVLLLVVWWKQGRISRRNVLLTLPYFVLGILLAGITVWLEQHHVGAQGKEWSFTFADRLLIAGRALWFYPAKLLLPYPLVFIYPKWQLNSSSLPQWVFPVTFVALIAALSALRKRIGRGPLTAVLFTAGTLFPALGFFNVYPMRYSFVADHFNYLGSIGWIALVCALAATAFHRRTQVRAVMLTVAGVVVAILTALTFQRAYALSDSERLWRDTLAKNPSATIAHTNLANLLTTQEKFDAALQHYEAALQLDPTDDFAHYNAGVNLYRQGKVEEAITHYREAIRIQPKYFEAHYNLGKALEQQGQAGQALESYKRSAEINPAFVPPRIAAAVLLVSMGQHDRAIAEYKAVLALELNNQLVHFNLGAVLLGANNRREAAHHLQQAVRLAPNDADAARLLEEATRPVR